MDKSGTKCFGLIGDPIDKSMSPALFRAGYGGKYRYDLITGSDFEVSYKRFLNSYDGINVTAPFKEKAFRKAGSSDQASKRIGASNLLVKTDDGIMAYNTDYIGIQMSLLKAAEGSGHIWRRALIAGCGGAGKAAAVAAGDLNLETVIINRTIEKAEEFASRLPQYGFKVKGPDAFPECFRQADVIIYTIPEKTVELDLLDRSDFKGGRFRCRTKYVLEANYTRPSFDEGLIGRMHEANPLLKYISGKEWLLYQAVGGYGIFTGEQPDSESMRGILDQEG